MLTLHRLRRQASARGQKVLSVQVLRVASAHSIAGPDLLRPAQQPAAITALAEHLQAKNPSTTVDSASKRGSASKENPWSDESRMKAALRPGPGDKGDMDDLEDRTGDRVAVIAPSLPLAGPLIPQEVTRLISNLAEAHDIIPVMRRAKLEAAKAGNFAR